MCLLGLTLLRSKDAGVRLALIVNRIQLLLEAGGRSGAGCREG